MDRLLAWYRLTSSTGAVVALLLANAIPLVGVVFLGWSVWNILIIYWLENGIVGGFNVLKMAYAQGDETGSVPAFRMKILGRPSTSSGKVALIPFFIVHYGIFWFVHGTFVLTMPFFSTLGTGIGLDRSGGAELGTILFAVIALTISHGLSFWWNYLIRGEYRRATAAGQMFAPYPRLVILHLTIIIGGIAISASGAPLVAIAILVGLKIIMDIGFHLAEHRKVDVGGPVVRD